MDGYMSVKNALENDNSKRLQDLNADLTKLIEVLNTKSIEEVLGAIDSSSSSLARNFGAETFIPRVARQQKKKFTAVR